MNKPKKHLGKYVDPRTELFVNDYFLMALMSSTFGFGLAGNSISVEKKIKYYSSNFSTAYSKGRKSLQTYVTNP